MPAMVGWTLPTVLPRLKRANVPFAACFAWFGVCSAGVLPHTFVQVFPYFAEL